MAVTETVKIVFEVDNKPISDTVTDLQQLGKVTEQDAAKFKQLGEASKQAAKDVTTLDKSIEDVVDTSKDVGKSSEGFVSLRTKVREAKEEVQRLSDKFGEFSPQANAARVKAGELADKMSDLNRQVGLLNPEAKIKAFTALGQGIVGSFQLATGALQAFGSENEEVQKIAQKLQGALNVVQGLQSIKQLKESYQDVKVVLGFTATAQQALNVAQVEGAAASGVAATGIRGLTAALASNPITAIAVAIGALAGAYLLLRNNTKEAAKEISGLEIAQRSFVNAQEKSIENAAKESAELKILVERTKLAVNGSIERDNALKEINSKYGTTLKNIDDENKLLKQLDETYIKLTESIKKKALVAAVEDELKKLYAEQIALELQSIKNQENISKKKEENLKQTQADNAAFSKQQSDLLNNLATIDKNATDKKKNQIKDSIDFLTKQLANAASGLSATFDTTEQTKKQAEAQKELRKEIETTLIPSSKLEEQVKDINKELEDTGKMAKRSLGDWKGSAQELIDKEEELMKKQEEKREIYFAVASELSQLALIGIQNQTDAEIEALETRKEAGLVSEAEYQKGIKKLRQKAAEDQKKAAIFQATLDLAAALINALTFKPAQAVPAALILATVTATANLAKIIATPIPKFNKGTLSVPGIDTGGDSVMAMLRPGEAVIPTDTNRSYAPSIKAIYQKQIKPSEINAFVLNKLSGRGSIGRDTAITASVDTFALSKAMNKNRAVEVTNANIVGKVIANEMMKAYNPRR